MKFKQKKSQKALLSDKIADALTVKPRADIEDDQIFHTKPSIVSRADFSSSDSEDEDAISEFRKRNVNLLSDISKKYEGEVVSRKKLQDSSDDDSFKDKEINLHTVSEVDKKGVTLSSDSEEESDDYSITKKLKKDNISSDESGSNEDEGSDGADEGSDGEDEGSDGEDEGSEDEDEGEGYDISQMAEPVKEEFEHVKKLNTSEEAKKGMCVRNQLLLWEGLLEMRIHLQRCMNTANRMPMEDTYKELKSSNDFVDESSLTINNVASVLDKFLTLQQLLLQKFPDTKTLSNNKQKSDPKESLKNDSDEEIPSDTDNEEIPSDTDEEDTSPTKEQNNSKKPHKQSQKKRKLEDYESDLSTSHKVFKNFRDTTIQKWNEKTRIATAANIKNTPSNTILQQISYILSDRNKLIRRTQLKRSEFDIIGYKKELNNVGDKEETIRDRKDNDEYIPEIFDDSDFYHQLLRELIECKSADISDPIQLSRQWIALQQMRSKMKRKVDTRATKGRKIKYVVHNPLVSFMAPEKSVKWSDESANELYSSLFGKMFEQNNLGVNVNLENVSIKN